MEKEPITIKGLEKLKEELIFLKEKKRPQIVASIAEARSHGDLKENAEYHAAKEEQGFVEGRIQEIESKLSRMQLIDVTQLTQDGRCVFGTTITTCFGWSDLVNPNVAKTTPSNPHIPVPMEVIVMMPLKSEHLPSLPNSTKNPTNPVQC